MPLVDIYGGSDMGTDEVFGDAERCFEAVLAAHMRWDEVHMPDAPPGVLAQGFVGHGGGYEVRLLHFEKDGESVWEGTMRSPQTGTMLRFRPELSAELGKRAVAFVATSGEQAALRDYGLRDPMPTGTPVWTATSPKVDCPNCGGRLCEVRCEGTFGDIEGVQIIIYLGCPACPFASPSVAAVPRDPAERRAPPRYPLKETEARRMGRIVVNGVSLLDAAKEALGFLQHGGETRRRRALQALKEIIDRIEVS